SSFLFFFSLLRSLSIFIFFPYTTLFRSYFFIIFAVVLISLGLFLFFQNSSFKKKLFKQDNKEDSFKPKSKLKRENYFNDKLLLRSEEHTSELQSRFELV